MTQAISLCRAPSLGLGGWGCRLPGSACRPLCRGPSRARPCVHSAGLGQLLVWEWQSESYVLKQQGHFNSMVALAYSPDGQYLATGGDDGKVGLGLGWEGRAVSSSWPPGRESQALTLGLPLLHPGS